MWASGHPVTRVLCSRPGLRQPLLALLLLQTRLLLLALLRERGRVPVIACAAREGLGMLLCPASAAVLVAAVWLLAAVWRQQLSGEGWKARGERLGRL